MILSFNISSFCPAFQADLVLFLSPQVVDHADMKILPFQGKSQFLTNTEGVLLS
jgi:hypothetical protein